MEHITDPAGLVEISLAGRVFPVRRPRVLDVGGGSGSSTVDLARAGAEVTVVDRSADALAMLERRAEDAGVRATVTGIQGDAENLARVVPDDSFDVVLLHRLLDAVDDPAAVVRAAVAAAVPGGLVSVTVPSRYSQLLDHLRHGRVGALGAVLPDSGQDVACWSATELSDLVTAAGLDVTALVGLDLWSLVDSSSRIESTPAPTLADLQRRSEIDPVLRELCPLLQVVGTVPAS